MRAALKFGVALGAGLSITNGSLVVTASAITVELAKKCNDLTAKAYPPRVIGNPAAGSAKGTAQDQRDYFSKCVAKDGNVDDNTPKTKK
jgi:hypothetical protein